MTTKRITIDMEAYRRLKRAKREGESFNAVIKRVVAGPMDIEAWLKRVSSAPMSETTAKAVESRVRSRRSIAVRRRSA